MVIKLKLFIHDNVIEASGQMKFILFTFLIFSRDIKIWENPFNLFLLMLFPGFDNLSVPKK